MDHAACRAPADPEGEEVGNSDKRPVTPASDDAGPPPSDQQGAGADRHGQQSELDEERRNRGMLTGGTGGGGARSGKSRCPGDNYQFAPATARASHVAHKAWQAAPIYSCPEPTCFNVG